MHPKPFEPNATPSKAVPDVLLQFSKALPQLKL